MIILKNADGKTTAVIVGQCASAIYPSLDNQNVELEDVSTFNIYGVLYEVKGSALDIARLIQSHNEGNEVIMVEEDSL